MTNRTRTSPGPQAPLATRLLTAALLVLAIATAAIASAAPAGAAAPTRTHQDDATTTTSTTVAPPTSVPTKGPGIYSAPEWLPLRHDLNGGEIKVGCTHDSHGSAGGYECGGHHAYWAIDFIATPGTPIYAAGSGFAHNATGQSGSSGYGNVVRIDHGNGVETLYAHMTTVILPPEGAWVDANTVIGIVGSTGTSSAPHLHFEKHVTNLAGQSESVDPGPLKACVLAHVVSYPEIRDQPTWDGLPWGLITVFSDGTTCDVAAPKTVAGTTPAEPTSTTSTTAPTVDGAPAGDAIKGQLPTGWLLMALANMGDAVPN